MTKAEYDVAVIGSGFAGSLMAAICCRLGRSVILLEKGKHPRFAIGESSTPLANLLLEDLATRYSLPSIGKLSKWGTWQQAHPHIGCGLKRGFSFYHHTLGAPAGDYADRDKQLFVAASPHNRISDTHWYRADFDHFLVQQAIDAGACYIDELHLASVCETERDVTIRGSKDGQPFTVCARFVIDATGPRGFLHRALSLGETGLEGFPPTQSLYTHFSGVKRVDDSSVALPGEVPPYPVDDAAVHHIFDGGWIWVLHFNNGITSAGVAMTDALAERVRLHEGEPAWNRLMSLLPQVADRFSNARPERPFAHIPRLSFRSAEIVGTRWALLPSAAGFVDPLLSTGFTLTLLGVARLAQMIEHGTERESLAQDLKAYAAKTANELAAATQLIAALYRSMGNFPQFVSISLLYFAAVSYSETVRRLGKPELASSFLLCDDPGFGPAARNLLERFRSGALDGRALGLEVSNLIKPFNIAGLADSVRRNWYPVDAADLLSNASKINATSEEIYRLLHRSGFCA